MAGIAQGNGGLAGTSNGLGIRTRVLNLAKSNMTETELSAALEYMAAGDVSGTNDAHTIAAVAPMTESGIFTSGTTDNVQVAIQGTGACTVGSNYGTGSTGVTSSLVADFIAHP